ncbi:MAG: hypothetical protein ACLFRG_22140 [Desulfococcaceae bacterium]
MKYGEEIKAAGSHDAYGIEDWLDSALSNLRRAIRSAEVCQCDEIAMDLGEIEDAIVEIMDAIDETAAWVDEGAPEEEAEETGETDDG